MFIAIPHATSVSISTNKKHRLDASTDDDADEYGANNPADKVFTHDPFPKEWDKWEGDYDAWEFKSKGL
jgi:hypothetical protein